MNTETNISDLDAVAIAAIFYVNPQSRSFYIKQGRLFYWYITVGENTKMHTEGDFDNVIRYLYKNKIPLPKSVRNYRNTIL
jgi:hypothetical protein